MPRRARVVIPGTPHHITQRGNNREQVFFATEDYRGYLDCLARHARLHGLSLLGYCLMPNHAHVIAVPRSEDSLSRALAGAHSEYALAFNRATGRSGHVWQSRFYSCPMDGPHLLRALCYVEMNPVRARLAATAWDWHWSSARAHTVEHAMDAVLDCRWADHFESWDYLEWKQVLGAGMMDGEEDAIRRATRTGEPLGSRGFLTALEKKAGRRLRVLERGRPRTPPAVKNYEQGSFFE